VGFAALGIREVLQKLVSLSALFLAATPSAGFWTRLALTLPPDFADFEVQSNFSSCLLWISASAAYFERLPQKFPILCEF